MKKSKTVEPVSVNFIFSIVESPTNKFNFCLQIEIIQIKGSFVFLAARTVKALETSIAILLAVDHFKEIIIAINNFIKNNYCNNCN
jgi:hypothetical protein